MTIYNRRAFITYSAILPSTILATKFQVARAGGLSHPFFAKAKNRPEVIAHQGGKGQWPGETLFAFDQATQIGVDILELDIRSTKDNQLVVMHNESVDATTNGRGRVRQFTFKDLQKLDAGFRWTADGGRTFPFRGKNLTVPTLEEVFEKFSDKRMSVEIKQSEPSLVEPLCKMIEKHKMEETVLVASFSDRVIEQFRVRCPKVATSASTPEFLRFHLGHNDFGGAGRKPDCLQVKDKILAVQAITRKLVERAHRLNLPVQAWTVNDMAGMQRMIALNVDGIITDFPGPLLALLGRSR
jgi:glycerophosphoryl diester phosphodiesterase